MKLRLERVDFGPNWTGGRLYIDGALFCHTLEDKDRSLEDGGMKVKGETAIPRGCYDVIIDRSQHFQCDLPHVLDVPQFTGIRIHPGNTDKDTEGCILVGEMQTGNWINNSRATFAKLMNVLMHELSMGGEIKLEVV